MLKNLSNGYYLSSSLDIKELSHLLGISKPQVARLSQSVNIFLQAEVLLFNKWRAEGQFNPKYFFALRAAFKECGEELSSLNFEHLLTLALDNTTSMAKWRFEFRVDYPCLEVSDYQRSDGVEGTIQVGTREEWNRRPASWLGFEDMAPSNMIVLIHEETSQCFFVEVIASKVNNQQDAIATSLLKLDGAEGISIHVKKTVLEPTGRISNRIREVLTDPNIREKGYISTISYALKKGGYSIDSSISPERDEVLKILKAEGWLRSVGDDRETWRQFLPFVKLFYARDFSDDERRRYETEGLSDTVEITSYRYLSKEHYELSLPIPYAVSSNPLFPFREGEKVKVRLEGKSLLITADDKSACKEL